MPSLSEAQLRGAQLYARTVRQALAEAGGDMSQVDLVAAATAAEAQMTAEELAAVRAMADRQPNMVLVNAWLVDNGALPGTIEELVLQ